MLVDNRSIWIGDLGMSHTILGCCVNATRSQAHLLMIKSVIIAINLFWFERLRFDTRLDETHDS